MGVCAADSVLIGAACMPLSAARGWFALAGGVAAVCVPAGVSRHVCPMRRGGGKSLSGNVMYSSTARCGC